jgi:hypothetical protein
MAMQIPCSMCVFFPSFYLIDDHNKIIEKMKGLNNDQIREALEELPEN